MDTFISNLTYGLIATSCTVLFVCGAGANLVAFVRLLSRELVWQYRACYLAMWLCGIAALAIALHFTL